MGDLGLPSGSCFPLTKPLLWNQNCVETEGGRASPVKFIQTKNELERFLRFNEGKLDSVEAGNLGSVPPVRELTAEFIAVQKMLPSSKTFGHELQFAAGFDRIQNKKLMNAE